MTLDPRVVGSILTEPTRHFGHRLSPRPSQRLARGAPQPAWCGTPMSPATVVGQDHMRVGTQAIRLDMTMSLDGFVVGPQDSREQPMGIGGFRLFYWLGHPPHPGSNGQGFAASSATPARSEERRVGEECRYWWSP